MAERTNSAATIGDGAQDEFTWHTSHAVGAHAYLLPGFAEALTGGGSIVDLGCGNGSLTAALIDHLGQPITGVDGSVSGIEQARRTHPSAAFEVVDLLAPLPQHLRGRFDVAMSSEVVEHLLLPRELFHRATESGASTFVVSTPYHGYVKNLALALTGKFDQHWNPLMDFGHVKFFSPDTLSRLGADCGWAVRDIRRLGRIGPLAKSMLARFVRV